MALGQVVRQYRRFEDWLEGQPLVHAAILAAVIGVSWTVSSVVISGEPLSSAVRQGLVATLSAFIVAGTILRARG